MDQLIKLRSCSVNRDQAGPDSGEGQLRRIKATKAINKSQLRGTVHYFPHASVKAISSTFIKPPFSAEILHAISFVRGSFASAAHAPSFTLHIYRLIASPALELRPRAVTELLLLLPHTARSVLAGGCADIRTLVTDT